MYFLERVREGRRYRYVGETEWDATRQRPRARQIMLGPVDAPAGVDLSKTETVGHKRIGDVGALAWVAEQLDVVRLIEGETVANAVQPSCQSA